VIRALLLIALSLAAASPAAAQTARVTAQTRFIDADRLAADPPRGLAEYAAAMKQLADEFAPAEADLKARAERLAALTGGDAEAARQDFARRREEAGARYEQRSKALLQPLFARIRQAADRFGRIRMIGDLQFAYPQDIDRFRQAGAREVTADFVAWYATNIAP
jgi:Skp family chaperone for outer membrane proteins